MTTKITVDAHAGWPVAVYALDSNRRLFTEETVVKESLLGIVPAGEKQDYHIHSSREIRCEELSRPNSTPETPKPLDFASVVRGLKAGKRFARRGWNGKGMFIFLVPGSVFTVNREPLLSILGDGTEVEYHAHIDMKTAQGYIVPWLASQADVLAEDWQAVEA